MNKTIVIVETDQSILELLIMLLMEEGYHVAGTLKFEEAQALVAKQKPKLVIIEYKLRGLEAVNLCSQFKNQYPDMKVLAISCNGDIGVKFETYGFNAFISKPFDIDEFLETIKIMLN